MPIKKEFRRKSSSKRRKIFEKRSVKSLKSLVRNYCDEVELEYDDTIITGIARDITEDFIKEVKENEENLFSTEKEIKLSDEKLVDFILQNMEDSVSSK